MNTKDQLFCAWSGVIFMIMMLVGWALMSGFLPPHAPTMTGEEVSAFYQANPTSIRLGLVIALLSSVLLIPFSALITVQMLKIEGPFPVWSYTQLAAAAGTVITFVVPFMMWQAVSFRPDRSPELMLLMNDLAWIPFVGATAPYYIAPIAIAIVGFRDKREQPFFPRWACYYNLWVATLVMPGCIIVMFKTGPFAWNGLFGWWLPLVDFGIWFIVMAVLMHRGVKRQAQQAASAAPAP